MQRANRLIEKLSRGLIASGSWFNQKEIAALVDCAPGRLNAWLRGRNDLEQVEILLKFLDYLPEKDWVAILREEIKLTAIPPKFHKSRNRRKKQLVFKRNVLGS